MWSTFMPNDNSIPGGKKSVKPTITHNYCGEHFTHNYVEPGTLVRAERTPEAVVASVVCGEAGGSKMSGVLGAGKSGAIANRLLPLVSSNFPDTTRTNLRPFVQRGA